jgi:DNA-binding NarL/FixJ family response regulator
MEQTDFNQGQQEEFGGVFLIADDDEFFRMALSAILRQKLGGAEIIEAGSLDEAIEQLSERGNVALALFDLAMPGMESAASLRAVRECFPSTQVAVVSASTRRSDVLLALEAGAHGYVPKSLGAAELAQALQAIRAGTIYAPPLVADIRGLESEPLHRSAKPEAPSAASLTRLTRRQHQVLELIVKGLSNKEIARQLNLGEGTVKVHVAALFRVLSVASRSAAAAEGARCLAPPPMQMQLAAPPAQQR